MVCGVIYMVLNPKSRFYVRKSMVFQTPNLERIERACRDRDRKYHVCQFCLEIVDFELEYNEFTLVSTDKDY